jgi:hypothetical protein
MAKVMNLAWRLEEFGVFLIILDARSIKLSEVISLSRDSDHVRIRRGWVNITGLVGF